MNTKHIVNIIVHIKKTLFIFIVFYFYYESGKNKANNFCNARRVRNV